jgi:ferrochelatase
MKTDARPGVLVLHYGTPASQEEIPAYYTHIRRGRPPTEELLSDLVRRYRAIGGLSPLSEQTAAQADRLAWALRTLWASSIPVVVGAKHAPVFLEDAVGSLAELGARRVVAVVLAPHYSRGSVEEYLERAEPAARDAGVELAALRSWAMLPGLVAHWARALERGLAEVGADPDEPGTMVLFSAHSLPVRVASGDDPYVDEVRSTAKAVARSAHLRAPWRLVWQSAGRTGDTWLGPDILVALEELAEQGVRRVVSCPVGFTSEHLEVLYDLDIDAATKASALGLGFVRCPVPGASPLVARSLAQAVLETGRRALGWTPRRQP